MAFRNAVNFELDLVRFRECAGERVLSTRGPLRKLQRNSPKALTTIFGVREDEIVSTYLRERAKIFENGEVGWSGDLIEAAIRELAAAGRVMLGFDILEPVFGGKLRPWGTSAFDIGPMLRSKSWEESVALSCELALIDVADTRRLTGLEGPYNDLWYVVVTATQEKIRADLVANPSLRWEVRARVRPRDNVDGREQ
jgi:hypothetical protein